MHEPTMEKCCTCINSNRSDSCASFDSLSEELGYS